MQNLYTMPPLLYHPRYMLQENIFYHLLNNKTFLFSTGMISVVKFIAKKWKIRNKNFMFKHNS